jgi:hypothetical protein
MRKTESANSSTMASLSFPCAGHPVLTCFIIALIKKETAQTENTSTLFCFSFSPKTLR